eukprot:1127816-Pleurochrysis_carterae.AAC.1
MVWRPSCVTRRNVEMPNWSVTCLLLASHIVSGRVGGAGRHDDPPDARKERCNHSKIAREK